MRYLSVCSGIEAATTAWHPLGFTPVAFSEIEPSPSAVLAHHWPEVPNLGDMTQHHDWTQRTGPIDLLAGGTPCQSFSIAGLREGLADPRGNLTLTYLAILAQYRPRWMVWENVPGVLTDRTNAFGQFLAGLSELGYGWAYRVLDAQYFGVPQRRRRVFVVGHLGSWTRAAAVLFEPHSLQGHPPPRRKTRQDPTTGFTCGPTGGELTDLAPTLDTRCKDGPIRNQLGAGILHPNQTPPQESRDHLVPHTLRGTGRGTPLVPELCPPLKAGGNKTGGNRRPGTDIDEVESLIVQAYGGNNTTGPIEAAAALNANRGAHNPGDFETGTLLVQPDPIAFSGRSRGDDGRGYDRPPQVFDNGIVGTLDTVKPHCIAFPERMSATQCASTEDLCPVLPSHNPTAIAFSSKDHGADAAADLAPTLRSMNHADSHANGGGQVAVAFQTRIARNGRGDMGDQVNALQANSGTTGKGDGAPCVATSQADGQFLQHGMVVRRLTPRECERLQGFPDDHTKIPSTRAQKRMQPGPPWPPIDPNDPKNHLADGPRYKAIGNSMAVPVMHWIGQRLQLIDSLISKHP